MVDLTFEPGAQAGNDLGQQCYPFGATDDVSFEDTEDVIITATSADPELSFPTGTGRAEVSIDILDDG